MVSQIPSGRRDKILKRLAAGQSVQSGALAGEFGISEDAIRRDLRSLAAEGLCRRVYGGALPIVPGSVPIAQRMEEGLSRKNALADAVVMLIEPERLLFLDNGSTNLAIAQRLPPDLGLTVATGSVAIAAALQARSDVDLILIGGAVDRVIGGAMDGTALEAISRLNIDLCVLGVCALSAASGASAFELADAIFKRALLARSGAVIAPVTTEKLGQQAPHRIAAIADLDRIVLEYDAPSECEDEMASLGSTMVRAAAPSQS